jgi:hypothetical protein
MIDTLRLFLTRPLADRDRARLFAIAAGVIAAAAGLLALLDRPAPPQPAATGPPPAAPRPAATTAPPTAVIERPSEEGRPPAAAAASHAEVRAAKRAARLFLAGYLPYSYGRGPARAIAGASPPLLRRLAHERPRVPAAERRRRARLVLLHADGAGKRAAAVVALVADGARRYTLPLELERARVGWRVTRVGS